MRLEDWVVQLADLRGVPEVMDVDRRVILIHDGDHHTRQVSSLAHAIAHVDLGHQPTAGVGSSRQERAADQLAARRLIPLAALIEALRWSGQDLAEAAEDLGVDLHMLVTRLTSLHPSESHQLRTEHP